MILVSWILYWKKLCIIDYYRERIQLIIWITHPSVSVRMAYKKVVRVSWNCQIEHKLILNYRRDLVCSCFYESAFFKGEKKKKKSLFCNPRILRSLYHSLFWPYPLCWAQILCIPCPFVFWLIYCILFSFTCYFSVLNIKSLLSQQIYRNVYLLLFSFSKTFWKGKMKTALSTNSCISLAFNFFMFWLIRE